MRRSTPNKASFTVVSPRLACVKPVASVHPEPGSNSPLYIWSFIFLYWIQSGNLSFLYYVRTVTENDPQGVDFSWTFHLSRLLTQKANAVSYLPVFFVYVILSLNSRPGVSFPKASAKVRRLYQTTKYFNNFFWTFFSTSTTKYSLLPFSTTTYTNKNILPLFTRFTKNFTKSSVHPAFLTMFLFHKTCGFYLRFWRNTSDRRCFLQ